MYLCDCPHPPSLSLVAVNTVKRSILRSFEKQVQQLKIDLKPIIIIIILLPTATRNMLKYVLSGRAFTAKTNVMKQTVL